MNITEIIIKKANKKALTDQEIDYFINNLNLKVKKYQTSALLMAIKLNGLNDAELIRYHNAIVNSGEVLDLDELRFDKHSTGGLGDKITIILAPILEAMGVSFWKISGRGLGYTGGTIDKLESIKGFKTNFSMNNILKGSFLNHNIIIGQSKNLVPADKYLYSVRDTSGSVESLELIAASVMSKKIAMGAKNILIDLKVGSGAFFKNLASAKKLGAKLKMLGEKNNRNVFILYTDMSEPLGKSIGNSIEVNEAVGFLQNQYKDANLEKLLRKIATEFYMKRYDSTYEVADEKFTKVLSSKAAYKAFLKILENQKVKEGDFKENKIFQPKVNTRIIAENNGYFKFNNLEDIGFFLISIKAGRGTDKATIYKHSGIDFFVKNGDYVYRGDLIAKIYSKEKLKQSQLEKFKSTYRIQKDKVAKSEIILGEDRW